MISREDIHVLLALAALLVFFLLVPAPAIPAELRIPTGPCPDAWHPFVDNCRRWPV